MSNIEYRGVKVDVRFCADAGVRHTWETYLDGELLCYFTTNGTRAMGVVVDEGEHQIQIQDVITVRLSSGEWRLTPLPYEQGNVVVLTVEQMNEYASVPFVLIPPYIDAVLAWRAEHTREKYQEELTKVFERATKKRESAARTARTLKLGEE